MFSLFNSAIVTNSYYDKGQVRAEDLLDKRFIMGPQFSVKFRSVNFISIVPYTDKWAFSTAQKRNFVFVC